MALRTGLDFLVRRQRRRTLRNGRAIDKEPAGLSIAHEIQRNLFRVCDVQGTRAVACLTVNVDARKGRAITVRRC